MPCPVLRRPLGGWRHPVLVSIPHFGTAPLPEITVAHYHDPEHARLPVAYTDTFAAEIYGGLHHHGVPVLATPYSRLFVDVNRRREDFEVHGDEIRSRRGVVRTHLGEDEPIFARPLSLADAERRLRRYYDPYHHVLDRLADSLVRRRGAGVLIDAHTATPRRMGEHQVVIGTRRGTTAHPRLRQRVAEVFEAHGFRPRHDVPGYSGGHIVHRHGLNRDRRLHAIQVEVNAALALTMPLREYCVRLARGERPVRDDACIARLRACMVELVTSLGIAVAELATGKPVDAEDQASR